jgi:arsenate reductase
MSLTIYHNPRCSKSRETLQLLHQQGHEPVVIQYLDVPVDAATLTGLQQKLGVSTTELMRTHEAEYQAAKTSIETMTSAEQMDWLAAHPKVLQRPIVVNGDRARIGRPPATVLEIVD